MATTSGPRAPTSSYFDACESGGGNPGGSGGDPPRGAELHSPRLVLRAPETADFAEFTEVVSRELESLQPWVTPPVSPTSFLHWVESLAEGSRMGWLVRQAVDQSLVGVVNLYGIQRASLQSAQLSYYAPASRCGQGRMTEAVETVVAHAFGTLHLHRLEANVQPANTRSRRLVQRLGFRMEGVSHAFQRVHGKWRDHERWALVRDEPGEEPS